MPQNVAVIFVHGIFNHELDFAKPMEQRLRKQLPKEKNRHVQFASVEWSGVVRDRQREFMRQAREDFQDIDDSKFRDFVMEGLGDAAAYQKTRHPEDSSYRHIQNRISEKLKILDDAKNRPLVFIGHSLGCHIISSYAWDLNKLKQRTEANIATEPDSYIRDFWKQLKNSPFRRLDTFAGFVTLGSNMPLFTFAFGADRVQPITEAPPNPGGPGLTPAFPGIALDKALFDQACWLNFFSKRDLLGFPLKPLYHMFDMRRLEDISVQSERVAARFVPWLAAFSAHVGYQENATVLQRTAKLISDVVGD